MTCETFINQKKNTILLLFKKDYKLSQSLFIEMYKKIIKFTRLKNFKNYKMMSYSVI